MNRYKLPWYKRRQNAIRDALRTCGWALLVAMIMTGWWYAMNAYEKVQFADVRISRAEADKVIAERATEDAFAILNGKHHVTTEDGSEVIANIQWEKTRLVEGLK